MVLLKTFSNKKTVKIFFSAILFVAFYKQEMRNRRKIKINYQKPNRTFYYTLSVKIIKITKNSLIMPIANNFYTT